MDFSEVRMRVMNRVGIGSVLGLGAALLLGHLGAACGSSQGTGGFHPSGSGGEGGAGAHHTGSANGGGLVGSGGGTISGPAAGGSTSSSINPDAACASSSTEATLVTLNMYIMFDDSGSMADNNKWTDASAALNAFFQDPGSAGLKVALRFFPDGQCTQGACDVNACAMPAVPMAALTADPAPMDMQEAALVASVNAHGPANGGGTPMSAALQGAENYALMYEAAHPTQKTVVVLVTDGMPNGCDETFGDIVNIAGTAFGQGILTFAVGLQGSSTMQMDQLAAAGGTSQAVFIGTGNGAEMQLLMALQAIRGTVVTCQFALPMTDQQGKKVDPSKVNVDYTPGGTGMSETIPQVDNAAACGNKDGWYYDNNAMPTTITLCPKTCQTVQNDPHAKIDILLGCQTMVAPH
jgi:hypothetical protein